MAALAWAVPAAVVAVEVRVATKGTIFPIFLFDRKRASTCDSSGSPEGSWYHQNKVGRSIPL